MKNYEMCEREYPSLEECGYIHESELPNFEALQDWLKGALNAVYETGDIESLQDSLEEMSYILEVKHPQKEHKIPVKSIMTSYLEEQRELIKYLKS